MSATFLPIPNSVTDISYLSSANTTVGRYEAASDSFVEGYCTHKDDLPVVSSLIDPHTGVFEDPKINDVLQKEANRRGTTIVVGTESGTKQVPYVILGQNTKYRMLDVTDLDVVTIDGNPFKIFIKQEAAELITLEEQEILENFNMLPQGAHLVTAAEPYINKPTKRIQSSSRYVPKQDADKKSPAKRNHVRYFIVDDITKPLSIDWDKGFEFQRQATRVAKNATGQGHKEIIGIQLRNDGAPIVQYDDVVWDPRQQHAQKRVNAQIINYIVRDVETDRDGNQVEPSAKGLLVVNPAPTR